MSVAITRTHNTMGVRTLGAAVAPLSMRSRRRTGGYFVLGGLGASADIISGMISEGYDPSVISTLAAAGASDDQLQALWDNFGAGTSDFANAANSLLTQLTHGPGGAASSPSYPQSTVPTTVSTAFGVYDLTQESSWNAINSIFVGVANELNAVATKFPGDATTAQQIQGFNQTVMQWAGYYDQMFGYSPSPLPLASTTGAPTLSGMRGLGVFPVLAVAALAAAVIAALAIAYSYHQWAQTKLAQSAVQATQAATAQQVSTAATTQANALLTQAAAAQAAGNTSLATSLRSQAAALMSPTITAAGLAVSPTAGTQLASFFTANWMYIALAIGAIVVLPNLVPPAPPRRRR